MRGRKLFKVFSPCAFHTVKACFTGCGCYFISIILWGLVKFHTGSERNAKKRDQSLRTSFEADRVKFPNRRWERRCLCAVSKSGREKKKQKAVAFADSPTTTEGRFFYVQSEGFCNQDQENIGDGNVLCIGLRLHVFYQNSGRLFNVGR